MSPDTVILSPKKSFRTAYILQFIVPYISFAVSIRFDIYRFASVPVAIDTLVSLSIGEIAALLFDVALI
jgi:hypothetical protein